MNRESFGRRDCWFCFSIAVIKGASKEYCIPEDSSVAFLVLFSFPLRTAKH